MNSHFMNANIPYSISLNANEMNNNISDKEESSEEFSVDSIFSKNI